jgi:hypothetical protein
MRPIHIGGDLDSDELENFRNSSEVLGKGRTVE